MKAYEKERNLHTTQQRSRLMDGEQPGKHPPTRKRSKSTGCSSPDEDLQPLIRSPWWPGSLSPREAYPRCCTALSRWPWPAVIQPRLSCNDVQPVAGASEADTTRKRFKILPTGPYGTFQRSTFQHLSEARMRLYQGNATKATFFSVFQDIPYHLYIISNVCPF